VLSMGFIGDEFALRIYRLAELNYFHLLHPTSIFITPNTPYHTSDSYLTRLGKSYRQTCGDAQDGRKTGITGLLYGLTPVSPRRLPDNKPPIRRDYRG